MQSPNDPILYEKLLDHVKAKSDFHGEMRGMGLLCGDKWRDRDIVFYGRAANAWVEPGFTLESLQANGERRHVAEQICAAGYDKSICELDDSKPFDRECVRCSAPATHWVHALRKKRPIRMTSTAFWATVLDVIGTASSNPAEDVRASKAAFSNLFRVGPKDGWNPASGLKAAQVDSCRDILKSELAALKPSAAVFLTERNEGRKGRFQKFENEWFFRFKRCFEGVDGLSPVDAMVHACDATVAGHRLRLVVTLRPENVRRADLVEQIQRALAA